VAKVTMPQLGESVAEGTIGKWLKKPGDHVAKYEPLLEVITDKVNAEVPSPFEGVLKEILVEEGATVPNNAEIAVIDEGGAAAAVAAPAATPEASPAKAAQPPAPAKPAQPPAENRRRILADGLERSERRAGPRARRLGRACRPRAARQRRRAHDPGGQAPAPGARPHGGDDRRDWRRRPHHA